MLDNAEMLFQALYDGRGTKGVMELCNRINCGCSGDDVAWGGALFVSYQPDCPLRFLKDYYALRFLKEYYAGVYDEPGILDFEVAD